MKPIEKTHKYLLLAEFDFDVDAFGDVDSHDLSHGALVNPEVEKPFVHPGPIASLGPKEKLAGDHCYTFDLLA